MKIGIEKVIEALAYGKGIEDIVDIASQFIGNPIIIVDLSFKTLAFTKNVMVSDPFWLEQTQLGYSSFEMVKHFRDIRSIEVVLENEMPVYFDKDPNNTYPWIIGKAVCNKRAIALVAVCMKNRLIQDDDLENVNLLCNIISAQMQKNNSFPFSFSIDIKKEYFISGLLEGTIKNDKEIENRANYLDFHLKCNLYILTISANNDNQISVYFTYIKNLIKSIIPDSEVIIYNKLIVTLFSHDSEKIIIKDMFKRIIDILKKESISFGLSMRFNNIINIRKYYLESLKAIELGQLINKEENFYSYEEYVIYDLFNVYAKYENIMDICHPALFNLIEYDRKNKSDYMNSLYVYLINEKKLTETANQLHLHRSSVEYRINKIKEIIKIDLDINNNTHLILSCMILYMMKYIK